MEDRLNVEAGAVDSRLYTATKNVSYCSSRVCAPLWMQVEITQLKFVSLFSYTVSIKIHGKKSGLNMYSSLIWKAIRLKHVFFLDMERFLKSIHSSLTYTVHYYYIYEYGYKLLIILYAFFVYYIYYVYCCLYALITIFS